MQLSTLFLSPFKTSHGQGMHPSLFFFASARGVVSGSAANHTAKITRVNQSLPTCSLRASLDGSHIGLSFKGRGLGSYCPPFPATGMDRRRSRETVVGGTSMRAPSCHPLGDLSLSSIPQRIEDFVATSSDGLASVDLRSDSPGGLP